MLNINQKLEELFYNKSIDIKWKIVDYMAVKIGYGINDETYNISSDHPIYNKSFDVIDGSLVHYYKKMMGEGSLNDMVNRTVEEFEQLLDTKFEEFIQHIQSCHIEEILNHNKIKV